MRRMSRMESVNVAGAGVALSVAGEGFGLAGAVLHVQTTKCVRVPQVYLYQYKMWHSVRNKQCHQRQLKILQPSIAKRGFHNCKMIGGLRS